MPNEPVGLNLTSRPHAERPELHTALRPVVAGERISTVGDAAEVVAGIPRGWSLPGLLHTRYEKFRARSPRAVVGNEGVSTTDHPIGTIAAVPAGMHLSGLLQAGYQEFRERLARAMVGDEGMSTAEYAIGTIAAAAFGAVLYQVVTGESIVGALTEIIDKALNTAV